MPGRTWPPVVTRSSRESSTEPTERTEHASVAPNVDTWTTCGSCSCIARSRSATPVTSTVRSADRSYSAKSGRLPDRLEAGEREGAPLLLQLLESGVGPVAPGMHVHAPGVDGHDREGDAADVEQGERHPHPVVGGEPEAVVRQGVREAAQRLVAQHRSLGRRGGPGGVDDD